MYQEIIMDHSKDPRNFRALSEATGSAEGFNPFCGDRVKVEVLLDQTGSELQEIGYQGEGCSICMASASMMCEEVEKGKVSEISQVIENFRAMMQDECDSAVFEDSDIEALAGVKKFPVRIKCALLAWMALRDALSDAGVKS